MYQTWRFSLQKSVYHNGQSKVVHDETKSIFFIDCVFHVDLFPWRVPLQGMKTNHFFIFLRQSLNWPTASLTLEYFISILIENLYLIAEDY